MIKVNLGSGFQGLDDWLNLDNSILAKLSRTPGLIPLLARLRGLPAGYAAIRWPPIRIHDCRRGLPCADGTVDWIYTSHFLEHLQRHETARLLKDCHRALKPGGRIRIVVPDLKALVALYAARATEWDGQPSDPVLPYTAGDCLSAQFFPQELNQLVPPGRLARFQERFLRRHQWLYDAESLGRLLEWAGFTAIEESAYRRSAMPDVLTLDCHPLASLHMEAARP